MRAKGNPPEIFHDWSFPVAGINLLRGFGDQQPVQMPGGEWGATTPSGINVRGWEPNTQRARGGSRPGLSRYLPVPPVSGWVLQELNQLTSVGSGSVQASQSGRIVTLVAVSQGNLYTATAGSTSWTQATNNTGLNPPLNFSGILYSTSLNQKLWFADGINWCYYDPSINTVLTWSASAGSLPTDSRGNTPRLICTWRGRVVLSGLLYDPQNIFFAAVGDPTNFDYTGASLVNQIQGAIVGAVVPTQAFVLNSGTAGIVGDVVTTLIPYNDDLLIIGTDHQIHQMSGDPMEGGRVDRISDTIGMAWGIPWARDPFGTIYFVSNQLGIYSMVPGQQPQRISQPIEQLVQAYNSGTNTIRVLWNDRFQGCHFFFSPTAGPGTTTHLFYEARTGAWWQDQYASTNFDPLCCCTFDGNTPTDRVPLIGSWDGYVRAVDRTATTDDGTAFTSSVVLGPLNTKDLDMLNVKFMQGVLGVNSGNVTFQVFTGASAEQALSSTAVLSGTWSNANGGRNLNNLIRRAGHAIYVKLTSTNYWALEQIRVSLESKGHTQQRGR